MFEKLIKSEFGEECVAEFKFHPTRRWRADYCIPNKKILIEVEGGIWTYGRHNHAAGYIKDLEKYNAATALGWSILRVQPKDLMTVETLSLIRDTIKNRYGNENTTNL